MSICQPWEPGQPGRGNWRAGIVKAAADFYSPISGEVWSATSACWTNPGLLNSDPFTDGWFIKVKPSDPSELDKLMDA